MITRPVFILIFTLWAGTAFPQPVLTAENLALGGGGTAYLTGFEANFINPANLMIRSRETNFHFGLGNAAYFHGPVLPADNLSGQFDNFRDLFKTYQPGATPVVAGHQAEILARNYKNNRLIAEHQQRFDILLGGIKWQREDKTFSIAARSRIATRIETGRGWYDAVFIEKDTTFVRDMTLVQESQSLHEFSFGYAQNFEFINGLIPRLSKLYIGIAPKFVISGAHLDLRHNSRYFLEPEQDQPRLVKSFTYYSSGNFTEATEAYRLTNNAGTAISQNFNSRFYTNPTGYGTGFDFGLTYILSLGDDISLAKTGRGEVLQKSLRLGLSITDIGFIAYNKKPLSMKNKPDTSFATPTIVDNVIFEGAPGQHLSFFNGADSAQNPFRDTGTEVERNSFLATLPTSFNAGMLLEINRIEVAADLILGLNDTAFTNTKLTGHFGLQFNPIKPVPIRLGARIAAGYPTLWSLGTGIEMKHWELSASARFSLRQASGSEFSGAAVGGLQFYF